MALNFRDFVVLQAYSSFEACSKITIIDYRINLD